MDKINNFIEQPPHNSHYNETIITKNINNVKVEILKHTLVKINDDYLAFSNHDTKMISIIPDEDLSNPCKIAWKVAQNVIIR